MEQTPLTDVYGLIFLLLIGGGLSAGFGGSRSAPAHRRKRSPAARHRHPGGGRAENTDTDSRGVCFSCGYGDRDDPVPRVLCEASQGRARQGAYRNDSGPGSAAGAWCFLSYGRTAVLPDNMSDEEGVHYASLAEHGTARSPVPPDPIIGSEQLTDAEAAALMKQKMSDGYEWRWRYTFIK